MDIPQDVIDRFWSKVDKCGDCWLWTAGKDADGYGIFTHRYKNYRAHRFSKMLVGEPIEAHQVTRHTCNNPSCVRPEHLIGGTISENVLDQVRAGTHARLKFSPELFAEIREAHAAGGETTRSLAARFGVSKSHVHHILKRKDVTSE